MKRLKQSLPLILIALGLLLSGGSDVTAKAPSQPHQRTKAQTESEQHKSIARPATTTFVQQSATPTPEHSEARANDQRYQSIPYGNDLPTWLQAIATILLVLFAAYQMIFIKRATGATEDAAKAAEDNARASREYARLAALSLKTNRPFLLPKDAMLKFDSIECDEQYFIGPIIVTFINYGIGPAIVRNVIADFRLMTLAVSSGQGIALDHKSHDLRECKPVGFKQGLTVSNGTFRIEVEGAEIVSSRVEAVVIKGDIDRLSGEEHTVFRISEETIASELNDTPVAVSEGLAVYGKLVYTDVFGDDNYDSEFCLNLFIKETGRNGGIIIVKSESSLGPKQHNHHT